MIVFGYVYYDGYAALNNEQNCTSGTRGPVPDASTPPPNPLTIDMTWLSQNGGWRQVWQNGVKVNVGDPGGAPATNIVGGAIGRGIGVADDYRFDGDIAEVVIFDAALTDADRLQMEAYFKTHWGL
jgi:hypothetical protein